MTDNSPNKRYLDSTKPGAVPVSSTSKPSIVKNKQVSHDPMMLESGLEDEPETKLLEAKKPVVKSGAVSLKSQNTPKENNQNLLTKFHKTSNPPKIQPILNSPDSQTSTSLDNEPVKSTETGKTDDSTSLSESTIATNTNQSNEIDLPQTVIENNLPQSEAVNNDIKEAINKKTYNLPIKKAKSKTVIIFIGLILIMVAILCFVIITVNK